MSKSCKTHFFLQGSQPQPNIRIIQCGYTAVPDWSHPNVNSPFWYLWRNCETGSTVISGDDCFELGPDHYLLIPPFTRFSTASRNASMTQFHIHFTIGDHFIPLRRRPVQIPAAEADHLAGPDFFSWLIARSGQPHSFPMTLFSIIYNVLGAIPAEACVPDGEICMSEHSRKFLEYVCRKFDNHQVYRNYCQRHGISAATLLRLFKQDTGMTPQQYLISLRIGEAKNLLLHTELTLDEIAEKTGFSDRYHFSKMFRKYSDVPPAAFRKKYRDGGMGLSLFRH